MVFGRLYGPLFGLLLFLSSLLGSIFILIPFTPLIPLHPTTWRACADRLVGYWLTFPSVRCLHSPGSLVIQSLCNYLLGITFHVTGDAICPDRPALLVMNHRTRLDWLFFWNALYIMNPWLLTSEKISLKAELRRVPGAGWAMGCGSYLFLSRHYPSDQLVMARTIAYYRAIGGAYQLLLFPEGTDRGAHAISRSDDFAEKHGLAKYEQVLHPRTAGFVHLVQLMKDHDYLDAVYDITVGYSDTIVSNELDLILHSRFPRHVHFDIRKVPGGEIPNGEGAAEWLKDVWKEKEKRLREFYEKEGDAREFEPSGEGLRWPTRVRGLGYLLAFSFWLLTSLLWLYFSLVSSFVRVYILACIGFYVFITYRHGGIEVFVIEQFFKRR